MRVLQDEQKHNWNTSPWSTKKKWKTNVWRLGLGQINEKNLFFLKHACSTGDNFFLLLPKDEPMKFIQEGNNHIWSVSLGSTKRKVKTNVWNLDFGEKLGFFSKMHSAPEEGKIF